MRIIAGQAKGRQIQPAWSGTRPTSDRAREALFSAIEALRGGWEGTRVLDLYAGSGALALEALSRGAAAATLVESHGRAVSGIRRNVRETGLAGATVVAEKVERFARRPAESAYDVAFLDPPYEVTNEEVEQVLAALAGNGWLAPGALVVVERSKRTPGFAWPDGLVAVRDRRYGEAVLWYGRAS